MKKNLMPLRRAVVEITNEAKEGDQTGVRKAVKAWHNRLASGSIPRYVVTKLGRELFLDLEAWDQWWEERSQKSASPKLGRPRTNNSNHYDNRNEMKNGRL
jgi:hypothetical protein